MSQVLKLLRLQIDNKYDFFKKNKKKSIKSLGGYLFTFAALYLVIFLLARHIISYLNLTINQEFVTIVFVTTQVIALVFGISSVLKHLYMSKDNELLIVLPVTFNQLYLSKILILYISELIFNLVYILPVLLAFGTIGVSYDALSGVYFLSTFILIWIMPILPLAIAVIISIPSMYIIKFFRKRQLLASIFIILLVAFVFLVYMKVVPSITGAFNIAEKQLETGFKVNFAIKKYGGNIPLYFWLSKSFLENSAIINQLFWFAGSMGLFGLCTLLIKPFYKNIILINNESIQVNGRKKEFKTRTVFNELLVTQFRLLFRSSSYVFEYLLFPLLMPIITVVYDKLLFSIVVNQMGKALIVASHVLVVGIIAFISNSLSSTAISRDGGMAYFVKTSPVSFYKQTFVKVLFNVIITASAIVLTTICCFILEKDVNPLVIILTSITVLFYSIGHICQSFDWDLRKPFLKWYDSSEITALNKNTTKSIGLGIFLAFMMFVVMALLYFDIIIGFIVNLVIGIMYAVSRVYLLYYRIEYYYNKMEI